LTVACRRAHFARACCKHRKHPWDIHYQFSKNSSPQRAIANKSHTFYVELSQCYGRGLPSSEYIGIIQVCIHFYGRAGLEPIYQLLYLLPFVCTHTLQIYTFMEESVTVLKLMSEILPNFFSLVFTPTIYQLLHLLPFVCTHTFQIYTFTEDSVLKLMS